MSISGINPELRRYLWLELSPRRLVIIPLIVGIILSPWIVLRTDLGSAADAGRWLFDLLVPLWGTWLIANSVVGEIRNRTWDLQRLSALSPWGMLWGKLLGAPVVVWYAGGLCLIPVIAHTFGAKGPVAALIELAYYVMLGLISHTAGLLASLIAIRKRTRQNWFGGFLFTIAGIVAGSAAATAWNSSRTSAGLIKTVVWYGHTFAAPDFILISLLIFTAWLVIGNWRLMRAELQMSNGPLVWIAFLVFIMAYEAGFADIVSELQWRHALRLASAGSTAAVLTYLMIFLEPKDPVHIRWLIDQFSRLRWDRLFGGLQSWMFAYVATVIVALWLVITINVPSPRELLDTLNLSVHGWHDRELDMPLLPWRALIIAALFFMTRDMLVFLTFNFAKRARRADFLSVLWLVILYSIVPWLVVGLGARPLLPVFVTYPTAPAWLGPVYPAVEALILAIIARGRLFSLERKTPAVKALSS